MVVLVVVLVERLCVASVVVGGSCNIILRDAVGVRVPDI
jgi:hypothetical protein